MTVNIEPSGSASQGRLTARHRLAALPFGKLSRFGTIGAINTATYAMLSSGLISLLGADPTLSSAAAFAACLPLAFWSHKLVTFRSSNGSREEFLRFATVQFISFCVAVLDMYVCVTLLGRPPAVAILLTIVIVPIISFIVMDRRVFKTKPVTL
jgi:putative flippase GtrA